MNLPGLEKRKGKIRLAELSLEQLTAKSDQPRKQFDERSLSELAVSIRENGILQPLLVRKAQNGYEVVAGERRLRAAQLAGLKKVPCLITELEEEEAAVCALVENLQRQDLSFFEEAEGIAHLMKGFGLTQQQAAQRLGRRQSTVANKLRLLRFSAEERNQIERFSLTERHARALLRIEEEALRMQLMKEVGKRELSVAKTEELVEQALSGRPAKAKRPIIVVKDVRIFFNTVAKALEVMRRSGIQASEEQRETEYYIEYKIRIPKNAAEGKHPA